MSTYRVEWPCCESVSETEAWEPEQCPFCAPIKSILITDKNKPQAVFIEGYGFVDEKAVRAIEKLYGIVT